MEGNIAFHGHAGFDMAGKLKIHYHDEPPDAEVPYFLAWKLVPESLHGAEGLTDVDHCKSFRWQKVSSEA